MRFPPSETLSAFIETTTCSAHQRMCVPFSQFLVRRVRYPKLDPSQPVSESLIDDACESIDHDIVVGVVAYPIS